VGEANALLPELEEAFLALEGRKAELERRVDRLKILDALWGEGIRDPANPDREEFLAARAGVRRAIQEIEQTVEERILALGVRFPQGGLEHGLVDFPTTWEGRVVFLCWQRGEEELTAWHEVNGGFRGRRPLTPEQAVLMGQEGRGD
jgi:hypothetical protein